MCGIVGVLGDCEVAQSLNYVERMLGAQHHRGPDDRGTFVRESPRSTLVLGSTRLAILDTSPAGHMPMVDCDSGCVLAYNGETYNYRALRSELAAASAFRSDTDTEVVLKSYARWGLDGLSRLDGMFSLALFNPLNETVTLARDRLGKKPLYWAEARRGNHRMFVFASEVRALLTSTLLDRRLSSIGLHTYLANGFLTAPVTLVDGIHSLEPGEVLQVSMLDFTRVHSSLGPQAHEQASATDRDLADRFTEAVARRLQSDVPVGVFLSGGLDSALIGSAVKASTPAPRALTIGFRETSFDESSAATERAQALDLQHEIVEVTRDSFTESVGSFLRSTDQPTFDGVNTYWVARAAKERDLKVCLSGIGGDELFGGYPWLRTIRRAARLRRGLRLLPTSFRRPGVTSVSGLTKLRDIDPDQIAELAAYQAVHAQFPSWSRAALTGERADPLACGLPATTFDSVTRGAPSDRWERIELFTRRLFLGERVLRDADQFGMASSVEIRAPFLDSRFTQVVRSISARERLAKAPRRPLERRLAEFLLPSELTLDASPTKRGFTMPFQTWLRDTPELLEPLSDRSAVEAVGLVPEAVARVVRAHSSGVVPWSRVWALCVLVRWCNEHRVSL